LEDARALFHRLVGLANDVGLLAEEYDPKLKRQVGNFPQAFSHIALINAAYTLAGAVAKTGGGEAPAQGAYANAQS
jgi:GH15 family glucan-1,4-alpha-glucosidase